MIKRIGVAAIGITIFLTLIVMPVSVYSQDSASSQNPKSQHGGPLRRLHQRRKMRRMQRRMRRRAAMRRFKSGSTSPSNSPASQAPAARQ
jgi:hypothetical protein